MPISASPAPAPAPAPSPTPSVSYSPGGAVATRSDDATAASQTDTKIVFSPPLIAMVIVIITAFLVITNSRLISKYLVTPLLNRLRHWRRRRRRRSQLASSSGGDLESFHRTNFHFVDQTDQFNTFSPYGLDDSVIKTIPLSVYNSKQSQKQNIVVIKDCAVCLLEFEENDYVRTLPNCSHSFHVDCIDIWLRSHANCPLCRARILISSASTSSSSPFIPLMAGRIRPSLDGILDSIVLEPLTEIQSENDPYSHAQTPEQPSTSRLELVNTFDFVDRRNLLLKRSHSFSYDRTSTSPWRSITNPSASASTTTSNFWNKRRLSVSSPFSALTKSRVFSFRSTRILTTTKSPFFNTNRRTRNGVVMGLFSFSESASRRRSKWTVASPTAASSRLRCGDPEALLSPERYNRR